MSDGCHCDFEMPEFYMAAARLARTEHRCYECFRAIHPGERYETVASKYDGAFSSVATCSRCLALREWVQAHVPCFCWAHGSMLDDAKDAIDEYAHECPGLFMGYGRLRVAVNCLLGMVEKRKGQ